MNEYRQKIEQLLGSAEESSIRLGLELAETMQIDIRDYIGGVALILDKNIQNITIKDIGRCTEYIEELAKKSSLYFSNQKIKKLPKQIELAKNAEYVYLTNNDFEELPDCFGGLQKMEKLYLMNNKLKHLPASIFELRNLTQLFLNYNKLEVLSPKIGQLQHLEMLSLSMNQLRTLPAEIRHLKKLNLFFIDENPFDFNQIPSVLWDRNETPEVIVKALERMRAYKLKRK